MAMVNLSARRPHRSRIAYAFGLLALLGAATTLVVLVRDPALSSTRLAEPVPAPEITVVESDPMAPDDMPGAWNGYATGDQAGRPAGDPAALPDGADPSPDPPDRDPDTSVRAAGGHTPEELSRSLFWSGVFGLAISLAGLGLVGTRRRMW
ncbi:hypothetical protein C1I95_12940 [Micromonospora craterilacus]|uniref:Uncharacterized protein n=1 Tax=Micromonospora craterilacus TaxID=1655439 RepID=A0A2W2FVB3_9ACTN|nr:hypothetical protein [Micromonospora craterilacus]PZG18764.1 hypothetical protein C1I95_12940 [Micromonospora craterilacus]